MRPRISGDGADMTLVRPGPSPAALVADETRPPSLSAASYVPGREVDEVDDRVDAVGVALADGGDHVGIARQNVRS